MTYIVTESVAEHPFESVSVSLYLVADFGDTDGFDDDDEKPEGELVHEYMLPAKKAPPIDIEEPEQMAVLEIIVPTVS